MSCIYRFLVFSVVACGLTFLLTTTGSAELKKHSQVKIVAGSPTGSWFPVGAAFADMTNKHYDGQPISVGPGGGIGNPTSVGTGKAHVGVSYGPYLKLAVKGGNELYPKAFPKLKAIAGMTMNKLHLIMAGDLAPDVLATAAQKKPKLKFGVGQKGSSEQFVMNLIAKVYGYDYDTIESWGGRVTKTGTTGLKNAFKDRQLDVFTLFIQAGAAKALDALTGRSGATLYNLDEKVRDSLKRQMGYLKTTIPAGTYPTVKQEINTVGLPFVVFATADLDAEMVYLMTKSCAENKPRMIQAGASFKAWQPKDMVNGTGIDFHEGAARYYKERGWIK